MICDPGVAALVEIVRIAHPKFGWKIVGNDFDNAVLIATAGKKRISFSRKYLLLATCNAVVSIERILPELETVS